MHFHFPFAHIRVKMELYRNAVVEFGGQGLDYMDELVELYVSHERVRILIEKAAKVLFQLSSDDLGPGIDLMRWIRMPATKPHDLQRTEWSYPLIFLTQMANYLVSLDLMQSTHQEFITQSVSAAIGHSQGVVSAIVFAISKNQDDFVQNTVHFVQYMFFHGLRVQQMRPMPSISDAITPMLSVRKLQVEMVEKVIVQVNQKLQLTSSTGLQVSLVNGYTSCCVSGPLSAVKVLHKTLETMCVGPHESQTRIPFSKRKPVVSMSYVNVSSPFHSELLKCAYPSIMDDVARLNLKCSPSDLQVPVFSTADPAGNMAESELDDLMPFIVEMQLTKAVNWISVWRKIQENRIQVSRVLDFGPEKGAAVLTSALVEGMGVQMIVATKKYMKVPQQSVQQAKLYGLTSFDKVMVEKSWCEKYCLKKVDESRLCNQFTRILGKPPIMIAGMTPTTSFDGIDLVAAATRAGYHVELAAGGLSRPQMFKTKVQELVSKCPIGTGININLLYLNAKQWAFQYPLVLQMRENGVPIQSVTIAAGVPTYEKAQEILSELHRVGIYTVAFKPGSTQAIYDVLHIAEMHPEMNIMLQWTGGRAGGHHSFEDFHQPLLATYPAIRRLSNVILVVGSGFGDWKDTYPYLTGEWSLKHNGMLAKMPVDGILLASRVMVAEEAATATSVKQLLVETPGVVAHGAWEESYTGEAGGILTVKSELGEPIHKVANRCTRCWRDFDLKYFAIEKEDMEKKLQLDRTEVIARLNTDYQKPYFGCTTGSADGQRIAAELHEMTYIQVLERMIQLMWIRTRWIHPTYLDRVNKFAERLEQVFWRPDMPHSSLDLSLLKKTPHELLRKVRDVYPRAGVFTVSVIDKDFFLNLCRTGGKPVNFIPILDRDFAFWFKKDSLWYSEDLEAAPDQDPQRVCILQGPVAVRYSTQCNEPVAEILENIRQGYLSKLPAEADIVKDSMCSNTATSLRLPTTPAEGDLPSPIEWRAELGNLVPDAAWLQTLLTCPHVVSEHKWRKNRVHDLIKPQYGQRIEIDPTKCRIFDYKISDSVPVVEIQKADDLIHVILREVRPSTSDLPQRIVPLHLKYEYFPLRSGAPIQEFVRDNAESIKEFYAYHWVAERDNEDESCRLACHSSVNDSSTSSVTLTKENLASYNSSIGIATTEPVSAPMDFATVAAWKPLIKSVFSVEVDGNLLNLVHLSHSYDYLCDQSMKGGVFFDGDEITSDCNVTAIRILPNGKQITGQVIVSRQNRPLVRIQSEFLIRGTEFDDYTQSFATEQYEAVLLLKTPALVSVLQSKSWFRSSLPLSLGDSIKFQLDSRVDYASALVFSRVRVTGVVIRGSEQVATVEYEGDERPDNPVFTFLDRHRDNEDRTHLFANNGYNMFETPLKIHVPKTADTYAQASHDLNPIHRSLYAAALANLPDGRPIMHGMWTATKLRNGLEQTFGATITKYHAQFEGMIYPGDALYMQARHIGMEDGKKIVQAQVVNGEGELMISARAHVNQPPTAFVFTGQGSAQVGMGMEVYESSVIARNIWDRGDKHLKDKFGFSILDIVKRNPKSIKIYFGGRKGRDIRENFMRLKCESDNGVGMVSLLPEITSVSQTFTFSAPEGLLFATQFSQPALVLLEKASFSEIQAADLISDDSFFAGHSLGEYAGLSSFAGALEIEDVVEIVFLRGLVMQKAVKRDKEGRSDYGMVAANPARVGEHFNESKLYEIVDLVSQTSGKLLQVVNFNVQDRQYVVAGSLVNLEALSLILTHCRSTPDVTIEQVVMECLEKAKRKKAPIVLSRGTATIPLAGIDVPFHSRELLNGVPSFRNLLRPKFDPQVLERQLNLLVNRYIPNLIAKPFSLEKSYVEEVYEATGSPLLGELLVPENWNQTSRADLTHTLIIELLAYQFASPVQWIQTQALLFNKKNGVERFIEVGPAPTLANMALRTLQSLPHQFGTRRRDILWSQRDRDAIFFELEDKYPSAREYAEMQKETQIPMVTEEEPMKVHVAPATTVVAPPAVATPVQDEPVSGDHVLRVFLAVRFNKSLSDVNETTSIKKLAAGKSAVQNEVLGDIEKEFGRLSVEDAADLPIKQLVSRFPDYKGLGKVTKGLTAKLISSRMPGGFPMSNVRNYFQAKHQLGPGRTDSVLVHGLLHSPVERLSSEGEAHRWLQMILNEYAQYAKINLSTSNVASGAIVSTNTSPAVVRKVEDAPVAAKHVLQAYLAMKFNKKVADIGDTITIKELSSGKSAVQNEVVGELGVEFGTAPDDTAELSMVELAGKFSSYDGPGKVMATKVSKLLSSSMPGGFTGSIARSFLGTERCLGPMRIESVLIHGLSMAPSSRLGTEEEAKSWLNKVTDDYGKHTSLTIPYASRATGPVSAASSAPTISSDLEKRLNTLVLDQTQVLNTFLQKDQLDEHRRLKVEMELRRRVEASLSTWLSEHDETYEKGIQPMFDARKERVYSSYWNWVTQDALSLYYQTIIEAKVEIPVLVSDTVEARSKHFEKMMPWINENVDSLNKPSSQPPLEWFRPFLCNRATPQLLQMTQYFVTRAHKEGNREYSQAIQLLVEQVEAWLTRDPVNIHIFEPTMPNLSISIDGELLYQEVPRTGIRDSIDYVHELARGLDYHTMKIIPEYSYVRRTSMKGVRGLETMSDESDYDSSDDEVEDPGEPPAIRPAHRAIKAAVSGPKLSALRFSLSKRKRSTAATVGERLKQIVLPYVHIRKPSEADPTIRLYDVDLTCMLLRCMGEMATTGVTFSDKVALVTGCGRNSIGVELVKSLLEGGATVFVTTSSFSQRTTDFFRQVYEQHGSRHSKLHILPVNQASKQDIESIIQHIYVKHQLDLDYVIPFAALSEAGRTVADIDGRSEVSHRIMLTNIVRLLGAVASEKKSRGIETRPALVVLPLSPNHGSFGGDGLYAESKLGIESLMEKWQSEGWRDQLSIVGAVIGWTRGTGLMSSNNIVAQGVEKLGVRTFSTREMAFNLSVLLHPTIVEQAIEGPVWADLSGGMAQIKDLQQKVSEIRAQLITESRIQAALHSEAERMEPEPEQQVPIKRINPMANFSTYFSKSIPILPSSQPNLLFDMLDLSKVVVFTGFGEVGPWGNSRTRWEMEAFGEFSMEGCIELAWLTGQIKYDQSKGWIRVSTNTPISDDSVKSELEMDLLQHAGIRIIEPELFEGYNPKAKQMLHQVAIDKNMAPIEVADEEEAIEFVNQLGADNVDMFQTDSGIWMIRLRRGAVLSIPRALFFERFVAGQIPTGWNAERLGIPQDIAQAVDPVTLYTLVSTAEALIASGITDPYEFYQYVHVSQVGNTSGGGMGGMRGLRRVYGERMLGKQLPNDSLQECFINTMPAWVNMLLLSSSGPIRTPVGACATAAESVDIGVDTIKSGKARVVIVGGYDDFGKEGSYEFAQMKATSDAEKEMNHGREPAEMCRPCTDTRDGFMESQGAGMQILMSAELALQMGCPIYGIVALTNTATDKTGRSVPAPGQGILTTAREVSSPIESPLLDLNHRRRQFDIELDCIREWKAKQDDFDDEYINQVEQRKIQSAQAMWGETFYHDRSDIAPLRGALNAWGLSMDDIGVASFHGTGTKANDKNESEVTQKQLRHLGRSDGNPLPAVCQKYLTGHPKGAAAAWMVNGALQMLQSGLIPGNRNNDNTCDSLRQYDLLTYPNRTMQTDGIRAVLLKSFGFGQASGEILVLHPNCLLSLLPSDQLQSYADSRAVRLNKSNTYLQQVVVGQHPLVQIKDQPPYTEKEESQVYLNPNARASFDPQVNTWTFRSTPATTSKPRRRRKVGIETQSISAALTYTANQVGISSTETTGFGVDVEPIATFADLTDREDFIRRNFTPQEETYCRQASCSASSFAGRWAAKEAVIKALSSTALDIPNLWHGPGAPLREIEIIRTKSGAPSVELSGHALHVQQKLGVRRLTISISHSGEYAVAQAVAY